MKNLSIAIDGPAAAGKSTIAKKLAKILRYTYIDTGAMYRCVAYFGLMQGYDLDDTRKVKEMLPFIDIRLMENQVFLNDVEVSKEIRQDIVSSNASKVATIREVREFLVAKQQEMAKHGGVILDGRDIGTVVLPDADLKIYQIASVEARANRRYKENLERGIACDLESIKEEIIERDYQDMHRKESPLRKADDAIEIDTSDLTIDEVVEKILELVKQKEEEHE